MSAAQETAAGEVRMAALGEHDSATSSADDVAVVLLDSAGTVRGWSRAAAELLGRSADQVCGQPVAKLLAEPVRGSGTHPRDGSPAVFSGRVAFRHASGRTVEATVDEVPLDGSSQRVLVLVPSRADGAQEQGSSLLTALLAQSLLGVVLCDTELRIVRTNIVDEVHGWPLLRPGHRLEDVMSVADAKDVGEQLHRVLDTGLPLLAREQRMRAPDGSGLERSVSVSAFRLADGHDRPTGIAAFFADSTRQRRARRRTEVGHEASARIGSSLDVTRTAQDIADVLVPALGDMASVEIAEAVLEGEEPPKVIRPGDWLRLRRVAVASADGPWPAELVPVGGVIPRFPDVPQVRRAAIQGDTVFNTTRQEMLDLLGDPELIRAVMPARGHSAVVSPLYARGLLLGFVAVWRTGQPEAFEQEDADLVFDISSRAALSVDNARRYTREHRAAVALQQRLLPRATTSTAAAESAGCYVPAGGGADISGDWFDAIPLPSLRVAFVVGDVFGHGLHAAATMGRLRTAIRTLADLELEPGELLIHLDDLVQQLADEADPEDKDTIGATCLYAVYDPLTGSCAIASAGHPGPAVIGPDGTARPIEVSPGPPLGVGGMPFEVTTVALEPGSTLALYTDGLVHRRSRDTDRGTRELLDTLATLCRGDGTLEEIGRAVMAGAAEPPPRDDMTLLLARPRLLPAADIADWQFPDDPAAVAEARGAVARRLAEWGLDDLTFTTELTVSELVTNAMRYAGGTVRLRLFHDDATLVCEVRDSSNTQPRLRRAQAADEGGRGLFLVAQLTRRWGSRYHHSGKTIWAEQPINGDPEPPADPTAAWDGDAL
ncbi:ATP-binding SpoIIE family protein phosphatase [Streptomyces geranii]|uniref:ATP-binding SpoIIE family protein phosphatase n=1 Tax=Streptomyces geranii TaxID=2058923 RepID=UPI0038CDBC92